jgi:hypothetical protein
VSQTVSHAAPNDISRQCFENRIARDALSA